MFHCSLGKKQFASRHIQTPSIITIFVITIINIATIYTLPEVPLNHQRSPLDRTTCRVELKLSEMSAQTYVELKCYSVWASFTSCSIKLSETFIFLKPGKNEQEINVFFIPNGSRLSETKVWNSCIKTNSCDCPTLIRHWSVLFNPLSHVFFFPLQFLKKPLLVHCVHLSCWKLPEK